MGIFEDVPLQVDAGISLPPMRVEDILALRPGAVVATTTPAGAAVQVYAGMARIAAGELSAAGSRVRVRISSLGSVC